MVRLWLSCAIILINGFPLSVCSLRFKHINSLMHICIHKTANFFLAFFCWEGLIAVNEKGNREGATHDGAKRSRTAPTLSARLSCWGLESQSSFDSFMEPGNEGALPIRKLNTSSRCYDFALKQLQLCVFIHICGHFNPLCLTV